MQRSQSQSSIFDLSQSRAEQKFSKLQRISSLNKPSLNITTNSSSHIKLPQIDGSPDNISKYEHNAYGSMKTSLPTLCLNKGWNDTLQLTNTSEFNPEISRINDHGNSTTQSVSKKGFKSNLFSPQSFIKGDKFQNQNPFKIFKDTEKLLYKHENFRRVEDEAYLSPLQIPLINKNKVMRKGRVREMDEIEPLAVPTRLQKKMPKSQSAKTLHQQSDEQTTMIQPDISVQTNQVSLRALMEKYDNMSFLKQKTRQSTKLAVIDILRRCNQFKENPKDYITLTREVLRTNMSIQNINEESEKLKDYIIMEQEKIREARQQFDEDKQRFNDYLDSINARNSQLISEQEKLIRQKNLINNYINDTNQQLKEVKNEIKKIQAALDENVDYKKFIEEVITHSDKKRVDDEEQEIKEGDDSQHQEQFFITEKINKVDIEKGIPVNPKQFKKMIMHVKKENLFLIEHINEEEKLMDIQNKDINKRIKEKEDSLKQFEENFQRIMRQFQMKKEKIGLYQKQTTTKKQQQNNSFVLPNEQDVQSLRDAINKIYLIIDPGKDPNRDTIKKLELVEYKLIQLIEERDFIMQYDPVKAQEVVDKERKLDLGRRNAKVERMKKAEKDAILEQQMKNDDRARKNMEKKVAVGLKPFMGRSQKEKPQREEKVQPQLTEEQVDFIKYVLS